MIGTTVIYEYREMCSPYHIACLHFDEQLSTEELEQKMANLIGWDAFDDWHRCALTFIDHNQLRGLTILNEEIDSDIKHKLHRFFPESLKHMDSDHSFGDFAYQYYDEKANEIIWMNKYHDQLVNHMNHIIVTSIKNKDDNINE